MKIIWLAGYLTAWCVGELGTAVFLVGLPILGVHALPPLALFCSIWGISFWMARHEPEWS